MKYIVKNTAVKFNHKVYNIGDEITLSTVPDSLTNILEPLTVKETNKPKDKPAKEPKEAEVQSTPNPVNNSKTIKGTAKKKS